MIDKCVAGYVLSLCAQGSWTIAERLRRQTERPVEL